MPLGKIYQIIPAFVAEHCKRYGSFKKITLDAKIDSDSNPNEEKKSKT
jgi:hypothetical protein